ncbi:hypothetical protein SLS64_002499 [Diaporthe eres]|uniref:Ankyrin repeat protein n=1 Tax=Diaporthe eres TaxID=83184 RepID=A0ABR1NVH3_DIAER
MKANIIRSFFQHDPEGAKQTRDAAGHGPLWVAFKHAKFEILLLVLELCGAYYSALQSGDALALKTDCGPEKIHMVFGLDCGDESIRVVVELDLGEIDRFICWSTGTQSVPEDHKMLQSLILNLPRETSTVDSDNSVPTSNNILRPGNTKPAKVLLSIEAAEKLPERCRPELGSLGRTQLRKLLTGSLRAKLDRFDIVKLLSHANEPGLLPEGRGPKIVSMLRQDGGYADLSRETRAQLIQTLEDNFAFAKEAGTQDLDGLNEYVETLIQYADAAEDWKLVASLKSVR